MDKNKKKKNNKIKRTVNFTNQVSFIFDTAALLNSDEKILTTSNKDKKLNIKIFNNGSIHCTGLCKDIKILIKALNIIFEKFKQPKIIDNKIIHFCDEPNSLIVQNVNDFHVCLINVIFLCDFNINRNKLYNHFLENGLHTTFDNGRLILKHKLTNNNNISLTIFESGSISISGASSCEEISEAYYYINNIIYDPQKKIINRPINKNIIINLIKTLNIK